MCFAPDSVGGASGKTTRQHSRVKVLATKRVKSELPESPSPAARRTTMYLSLMQHAPCKCVYIVGPVTACEPAIGSDNGPMYTWLATQPAETQRWCASTHAGNASTKLTATHMHQQIPPASSSNRVETQPAHAAHHRTTWPGICTDSADKPKGALCTQHAPGRQHTHHRHTTLEDQTPL